MSLSYDEYVRITNMLVYQLRRLEVLADNDEQDFEAAADDNMAMGGLTKSQLVDWYLEQIESELETEAQYHQMRAQVSAVVERLTHKDSILIELKASLSDDQQLGEPVLVVHPNYVPS